MKKWELGNPDAGGSEKCIEMREKADDACGKIYKNCFESLYPLTKIIWNAIINCACIGRAVGNGNAAKIKKKSRFMHTISVYAHGGNSAAVVE